MAGISITWTASSANYDISAQGFDDWALWNSGTGSGTTVAPSQRKSGGGSTIGSMTRTVATLDGFTAAVRQATWSGGTPTASGANTNAIFNTLNSGSTSTAGSDCSVTLPADTTQREAKYYFDAYSSAVTLTCTLSDGSAGPTTNTSLNTGAGAAGGGFYTITYSAGSASQTLTVKAVATTALAPFSDVEPQGIGYKVLSSGVAGTVAWTEANDTASVAGSVTVSGTTAWTEANDTASVVGAVTVSGGASWTEANDSAAIAGSLTVSGGPSWTEANDTAAIAGNLTVSGSASWTESNDTASLTGTVGNVVAGAVAWTEASDTASLAGTLTVSGAVAWVETSDSWTVNGLVTQPAVGALAWVEDSDSWSITGTGGTTGGGGFDSVHWRKKKKPAVTVAGPTGPTLRETIEEVVASLEPKAPKAPKSKPFDFAQDDDEVLMLLL